jgi:hypothetical protein
MHTIDITSANSQFNGVIKAGEYVAFWISDDSQASLPMTDGSYKTAEEAEAAAVALGEETGTEGGIYQASMVTAE